MDSFRIDALLEQTKEILNTSTFNAEAAEKFLRRQPRKHEDTKKANVLFVFSCLRGCIFP